MRKSLPFLTVPLVVASSLIYSPANAAPATAWAPTAQHLASTSTHMLSRDEVPMSLDLSPGWGFTSKSGYPLALNLCTFGGQPIMAPPVTSMYQVILGESKPISSRTALTQSVWVHKSERAALDALANISTDGEKCSAKHVADGLEISNDENYTFILQSGSAILSLNYTVPAGRTLTAELKQEVRKLAKNLSVKWAAPAGTEKFFDPSASGAELAQAFFSLLQSASTPIEVLTVTPAQSRKLQKVVRPFLDPAFQLVRANGERYLASNYIPSDTGEFEIDNVVATAPTAGLIVARYRIRTPGATTPDSGLLLSDDYKPRLTTFRWDESTNRWALVSHANFNSPVAAICNQELIKVAAESPRTSTSDVALGESLVRAWRDTTLGVSGVTVRHPANQIQLADGRGWPTTDGAPIKWSPASAYAVEDIAITRNGNLLVASYDAVSSGLVLEGDTYRPKAAPRLLTYIQTAEGKWELLALGNFNVPEGIPQGVACVGSSS